MKNRSKPLVADLAVSYQGNAFNQIRRSILGNALLGVCRWTLICGMVGASAASANTASKIELAGSAPQSKGDDTDRGTPMDEVEVSATYWPRPTGWGSTHRPF
ncbi:hypothetical protein, partial [Pseudomarimonas arenosa]|uniref:hypothetical protein n=1 Tax=Pseudomarimonas arenosa TaxID=2774145 RepID=UPI001CDBFD31